METQLIHLFFDARCEGCASVRRGRDQLTAEQRKRFELAPDALWVTDNSYTERIHLRHWPLSGRR